MRAAVRQEMADTLAGLGNWWNALPASDRAGDGESMRLLRSVVGSMYSLMPDCGAEQYAAALDSLERRAGVEEAAEVYLSLARGLFSYAAGQAADDIALGMRLAREEGDGRTLTLGEELLGKQSALMSGTYVEAHADAEADGPCACAGGSACRGAGRGRDSVAQGAEAQIGELCSESVYRDL